MTEVDGRTGTTTRYNWKIHKAEVHTFIRTSGGSCSGTGRQQRGTDITILATMYHWQFTESFDAHVTRPSSPPLPPLPHVARSLARPASSHSLTRSLTVGRSRHRQRP